MEWIYQVDLNLQDDLKIDSEEEIDETFVQKVINRAAAERGKRVKKLMFRGDNVIVSHEQMEQSDVYLFKRGIAEQLIKCAELPPQTEGECPADADDNEKAVFAAMQKGLTQGLHPRWLAGIERFAYRNPDYPNIKELVLKSYRMAGSYLVKKLKNGEMEKWQAKDLLSLLGNENDPEVCEARRFIEFGEG